MRLEILREYRDNATIGHLSIFDEKNNLLFSCKSLELPWKENQRKVSCIPEGEYDVIKMTPTAKRPYTYLHVLNVPGRDSILFHPGNYTRQILGCILPGEKHIDLDKDGTIDITNTTATLKMMTAILPNRFKLIIKKKPV
jgi:hypothetical protein